MRFAVVTSRTTDANQALAASTPLGVDGLVLSPPEALSALRPGDLALGRIDVAPTMDGAEPGLDVLIELDGRGIRVLNRSDALLTAHDKLLTARALERAGLPHPLTEWVPAPTAPITIPPPVVVKPRFGSWGRDVLRCEDPQSCERTLASLADRPWFHSDGALVQELLPVLGFDLRLVVAGGRVVGAIERVAAPGEWRTNVSLGGTRRAVESVPADAARLAVAAAAAVGIDLGGVDLLPTPGGWVVLEVNGAVEFTAEYALNGTSPFADAVAALMPVERAAAATG